MRPDPRSRRFALLALLLAGAFGFRVTATPMVWGCMTGGTSAPAHGGHHEHGHQAPGSPPPACECIAHAPATAVTLEQPPLLVTGARPVAVARVAAPDQSLPAGSPAHLLPFSIGPPALLA